MFFRPMLEQCATPCPTACRFQRQGGLTAKSGFQKRPISLGRDIITLQKLSRCCHGFEIGLIVLHGNTHVECEMPQCDGLNSPFQYVRIQNAR